MLAYLNKTLPATVGRGVLPCAGAMFAYLYRVGPVTGTSGMEGGAGKKKAIEICIYKTVF
jgi:hypothetical protein